MKPSRLPILAQREQTHGRFTDNARISQAIKEVIHSSPQWKNRQQTLINECPKRLELAPNKKNTIHKKTIKNLTKPATALLFRGAF